MLMWLITLSMDRACSHLSKTPIQFLLTTTTSRESDVGVLLPWYCCWGGGGISVVVVGGGVFCVLLFLVGYCVVLSMMAESIIQQSTSLAVSLSSVPPILNPLH